MSLVEVDSIVVVCGVWVKGEFGERVVSSLSVYPSRELNEPTAAAEDFNINLIRPIVGVSLVEEESAKRPRRSGALDSGFIAAVKVEVTRRNLATFILVR